MGRFKDFGDIAGQEFNRASASREDFLYSRHARHLVANVGKDTASPYREDFEKCNTRKALRKYISKYTSDLNNPFLNEAADKLESLDFAEAKMSIFEADEYLRNHPHGKHEKEVRVIRAKLEAERTQKEIVEKVEKKKDDEWVAIVSLVIFASVFLLSFFVLEIDIKASAILAITCGGGFLTALKSKN